MGINFASAPGGIMVGCWETDSLNCMVLNDIQPFKMPVVQGRRLVSMVTRFLFLERDADLIQAPSFQFMQNGVAISASQTTLAAQINLLSVPLDLSLNSSPVQAPDMSLSPMQLKIVLAATGTGLTVCNGVGVLLAYYR